MSAAREARLSTATLGPRGFTLFGPNILSHWIPIIFSDRIDGATLVDLGYADAKRYLAQRAPTGCR